MAIDDHTRKSYDKTDKIYGSDETGLKPIQQVRIHFHRLDFPADLRRKSKRWIKNDRLKQQVEETGQSHGRKADRENRRSRKEDREKKIKKEKQNHFMLSRQQNGRVLKPGNGINR